MRRMFKWATQSEARHLKKKERLTHTLSDALPWKHILFTIHSFPRKQKQKNNKTGERDNRRSRAPIRPPIFTKHRRAAAALTLWHAARLHPSAAETVFLSRWALLLQCDKKRNHVDRSSSGGGTYVLLPHDVVEGELRAPRGLVEGGAAGPAVGRAGRLLHDVLRQREQALLWLLDQVRLDVVAPEEVVAVFPVAFLHLVVAVQTVQSSFGDVDPPETGSRNQIK